jgi:transporter family protein
MKSAVMIAIIVFCTSAANVLIARGMRQVGEVSILRPGLVASLIKRVLKNASFLMSVVLMALSFFAFLAILSWDDVSLVIPATSLEYVLSTMGAKYILKERISSLRWAGICLVCIGVALILLP